jgi:hypothetical protein
MKMKPVIAFLAVIAVFALGVWFAYRFGYRSATSADVVARDAYFRLHESSRVRGIVQVLRCLDEGKQADAVKTLHAYFDGTVGSFGAFDYAPGREGYVDQALREARTYRISHPWTNDQPHVEENVREVLKKAD